MDKKIKIDDLKSAIMSSLDNYQKDVTVKLKDEIRKANRNGLKMVKNKSPERTGVYGKSWSSKKMFENNQALRYWIHNKKKWQLTHLLEYGHYKWLWGIDKSPERVEAKPHITPTAKWVQKELPKGVKQRIK